MQENFFEAIAASVLFVDGIVKNQQKNRNKLYTIEPNKNTKRNATAVCSFRGSSLLRGVGEVDFIDVAIASMFVLYLLTCLICIDRYLFCMWRKPGIFLTGLWRMPARFFRPSSKVGASHSPVVRGSAHREPPLCVRFRNVIKRCRSSRIKIKAVCLIFLLVSESRKKGYAAEKQQQQQPK